MARIKALWRSAARHSIMLSNAAALSAGAGISAALGFLYWWLAAQMFTPAAVGFAAAAISLMNLLALVSELGMGTMLIGELSKSPKTASALISATLMSATALAVATGLSFLALAQILSIDLGSIMAGAVGKAVFIIGLAVTCFTLVLDQAFVAMLQSSLQMYRTISFAVIKLVLLAAAAAVGTMTELGIFGTWIVGQVCSIAMLVGLLVYAGRRLWHRPGIRILKPLFGTVIRHHVLSISIQAPGLILPLIVTAVLSPQTNAAFYAAWMLVNVVLLVPASLTSVLYSVAAGEPASLPHRLRVSLAISLGVAAVSAAVFFVGAEFILGLFNSAYAPIAGGSLSVLGLGVLGTVVKYHYVVVQRLNDRMLGASSIIGLCGVLELSAAIIGARSGGLFGLTAGWLLVVCLEIAVWSPALFRALRGGVTDIRPTAEQPHNPELTTLAESSGVLACRPT